MDDILDRIELLARECGQILLDANRDDIDIDTKEGIGNYVTNYDTLIQEKIKKELAVIMPEASFMGEEGNDNHISESEYIFVVDPIDGTANFARDLKLSAISIGLLKNNKPYLGVCYLPYVNELYKAVKGNGAYLNNKRIHVSNKLLKEGIVYSGCAPYYGELRERSLMNTVSFATGASDFRRAGSAVIELCSVAAGKAEVYFELKIQPWDFCGASIIVKEAGGTLTTIDGDEIDYLHPSSVLASNGMEDYSKYVK